VIGFGRAALERWDLLPEMVQHGVRRRMPIVGAAMHLAAGDDVDAGELLVEHCGLRGAILRVRHRRHRQLTDSDQAVERLVPVRHAVGEIKVVAYLG
jgi:hypothetical protein